MQVLAIANHVFIYYEDAIARREEVVPRLFEPSLAYQHHASSQSYAQTENLDPVVLTVLIQ